MRPMRHPVSTRRCRNGCRVAVRRFAGDPAGRPLGSDRVEPGARLAGNHDRDVLLQAEVADRVVGHPVLPVAPQDAALGASEGAQDCYAASCARGHPRAIRPRVSVAGRVGEGTGGLSEAFVAAPAEGSDLALAGLDCHGARANGQVTPALPRRPRQPKDAQ
jgi:hypothetical protein